MSITLANLDAKVQRKLRNVTNSPFGQSDRVSTYNDVIDFLQSKSNWNFTEEIVPFDFLNKEVDYSTENDLGITNFKQQREIRLVEDNSFYQTQKFEEIKNTDLSIMERRNNFDNKFAFEDREGNLILRLLSDLGTGDEVVDGMNDLDTNRTWVSDTGGSDATTLEEDEDRAKDGNSLKFNIDVSQSVNNFARAYTSVEFTNPIDGSAIENFGYFRFWVGLHSMSAVNLALVSSITFVWGDDATGTTPATKVNYWSRTITNPVTGGDFKATWNRMSFDWAGATKTGSPDSSDLKYFEIQVNYTSGMTDTLNIRLDQIKMFTPKEAEFAYFSTDFVDNSGTRQEHFTTGTVNTAETLLLPQKHLNLFINLALKDLFPQKARSNNDYSRVKSEAEDQLELAISQDGNAIVREKQEFDLEGNSNGRISNNQW